VYLVNLAELHKVNRCIRAIAIKKEELIATVR
jgi:hypothetical protein